MLISLSLAEKPGGAELCQWNILKLEDISSDICENSYFDVTKAIFWISDLQSSKLGKKCKMWRDCSLKLLICTLQNVAKILVIKETRVLVNSKLTFIIQS